MQVLKSILKGSCFLFPQCIRCCIALLAQALVGASNRSGQLLKGPVARSWEAPRRDGSTALSIDRNQDLKPYPASPTSHLRHQPSLDRPPNFHQAGASTSTSSRTARSADNSQVESVFGGQHALPRADSHVHRASVLQHGRSDAGSLRQQVKLSVQFSYC